MWGASWSGVVGDSPADWPRPPGARKHPGEGVERSFSGQATARPTDRHHHGSCSPSQQPSATPVAAAANAEAKAPPGSRPGGRPTGAPPRVLLPLLAPSRCAWLTWASSSRRRTRLALASSAWRPTRPGHGSRSTVSPSPDMWARAPSERNSSARSSRPKTRELRSLS